MAYDCYTRSSAEWTVYGFLGADDGGGRAVYEGHDGWDQCGTDCGGGTGVVDGEEGGICAEG